MGYTFKSENGYCPECVVGDRKFYIKDRCSGTNYYEHCLFSMPVKKPDPIKFANREAVAKWLNGDESDRTYDIDIANYIIAMHALDYYQERAILEKADKMYVFRKENCSLTEVIEPKKETGWFDRYIDCLSVAKEILRKREECEQISLFK